MQVRNSIRADDQMTIQSERLFSTEFDTLLLQEKLQKCPPSSSHRLPTKSISCPFSTFPLIACCLSIFSDLLISSQSFRKFPRSLYASWLRNGDSWSCDVCDLELGRNGKANRRERERWRVSNEWQDAREKVTIKRRLTLFRDLASR